MMIKEGIHLMDCKKGMKKIRSDSVDLICTDPPYVKDQWEAAYSNLAEGAARILKPGGYLITYCGHYYLPGVLDILRSERLIYYWTVCQINTGSKSLMHHRNILAGFKPILIFQKAPLNPTNKIFMDVISGRQSKDHHPWEQSIHEALHLLSRFGGPRDLMVDPFTGSGTWLLAAQLLGIRFISRPGVMRGRGKTPPFRVEMKRLPHRHVTGMYRSTVVSALMALYCKSKQDSMYVWGANILGRS